MYQIQTGSELSDWDQAYMRKERKREKEREKERGGAQAVEVKYAHRYLFYL